MTKKLQYEQPTLQEKLSKDIGQCIIALIVAVILIVLIGIGLVIKV